jgi:glycine dehydrogenase
MGYYDTITPAVILRNVLENPVWYTSYTPYQAEISQGRLEALLNFQTMVCELTAMEIANASLLDEATAAAEAMVMMFNLRSRKMEKEGVNVVLVDEKVWPQTLEVLYTRSEPLGIELKIMPKDSFEFDR